MSLFTILKRGFPVSWLHFLNTTTQTENNPRLLFILKVTWSWPRMFASLFIFTKLHLFPTPPPSFLLHHSFRNKDHILLSSYGDWERGSALGLALFISRPLYIRFAFLFYWEVLQKHCTSMKSSLNFSDIKVITPKFTSDIYNCTWVDIKPSQ